ncbi:hypothetical protein [Nocardioides sp. InS609-2]|uniref:hypothetical protein n=1 Tax=Nocardioides sp. InS609-2 TaxID=2760705 RepID=UPI0020C15082|nr:hypothetical protein [Nocardioides sp. InS609-2]
MDPYGHLELATHFMDHLRKTLPDQFVAAGVSPSNRSEYWVKLTQEPSPKLLDELSKQSFTTTVEFGYVATALELRETTQDVAIALNTAAGIDGVETGPAEDHKSVIATYSVEDGIKVTAEDLRDRFAPGASFAVESLIDTPVLLNEVPEAGYTETTDVRGGHNRDSGCTSGFTANYGARPEASRRVTA